MKDDPKAFAYWLWGLFELSTPDADPAKLGFTPAQAAMIKEHLQLVFTKVTGPKLSNEGQYCFKLAGSDTEPMTYTRPLVFDAISEGPVCGSAPVVAASQLRCSLTQDTAPTSLHQLRSNWPATGEDQMSFTIHTC